MYEARVEHDTHLIKASWQQTASLMALTANCHRDPKKSKAYKPDDFNPFAEKKKVVVGIEAMRMFLPPTDPNYIDPRTFQAAESSHAAAVDIVTRATSTITTPATES